MAEKMKYKINERKWIMIDIQNEQEDVCVFYGRDRGETGNEPQIVNRDQLDKDIFIEYVYVYDLDNKWRYFEGGDYQKTRLMLLLYFHLKGGQYIENNKKIIGRNNHPNAYNAMGEKKMEEKILRSKERVYEENGSTITIVREFEGDGSSILEQTISFLIDKMNETEKDSLSNSKVDLEM